MKFRLKETKVVPTTEATLSVNNITGALELVLEGVVVLHITSEGNLYRYANLVSNPKLGLQVESTNGRIKLQE